MVLLVRNWDTVKEAAGKCWDWIKDKWNSVANWFNNAVVQPIARFFGGLWNGIKNGASTLADFIKRYVIEPIVDAFKWLYNGVVGIIEGVINAFIGIINGFISGINWVIETINKIPGIKLSTIQTMNQVHIPRMAAGGVAYGPRVAEIGEYIGARNNPEVVAPLDRLRSIIGDTRTDDKIVMLLESIYGRLDKLELTVINRIGDDLIGTAAERYRANQGVRMINR